MGLVRKLSRYGPIYLSDDLTLKNLTDTNKAYKIKTNNPQAYLVNFWPYLDNFLTIPYTFLAYSGDSDPD